MLLELGTLKERYLRWPLFGLVAVNVEAKLALKKLLVFDIIEFQGFIRRFVAVKSRIYSGKPKGPND